MKIKHWLVSFLISFSQIAFADTVLDEVSKSVISVCHAPSSKGQKWDVQVLASGDVKVGLKFAGKVAADAKVALTKSGMAYNKFLGNINNWIMTVIEIV